MLNKNNQKQTDGQNTESWWNKNRAVVWTFMAILGVATIAAFVGVHKRAQANKQNGPATGKTLSEYTKTQSKIAHYADSLRGMNR